MTRIDLDRREAFEEHSWKGTVDDDTLTVYAAYARDTYLEAPWALVLVDPYASMFPAVREPVVSAVRTNSRSCGSFAWDAREPMLELLALARKHAVPVVVTTARTGADAGTATHRPASADPGSDYALEEGFAPWPGEHLVQKDHASAFLDTDLADHLRQAGVRTVVLGGATTSGCLRATAVDCHSAGFHTVIVEEAVFDRSHLSHVVNLFDLHHKYADVVALQTLASAL